MLATVQRGTPVDTGLALTVKPSCDSRISKKGNVNPNAPGQALGGNEPGHGQNDILTALAVGSGIQPALIAIVKTLLRLDPQALRAFRAIISVLNSPNTNQS